MPIAIVRGLREPRWGVSASASCAVGSQAARSAVYGILGLPITSASGGRGREKLRVCNPSTPHHTRSETLGHRGEDSARVQSVPGLRHLANGIGHIARAELRPGTPEKPGAGQEVEPHPPAGYMYKGPHLARLGGLGLAGRRQVRLMGA
jgi:hypothetical protein